MLNRLTKLALSATAALIAANTHADAAAKIKAFDYDVSSLVTTLHVTSSDGAAWDTLKPGTLQFFAHLKLDTKWPGAIDDIAIVLGACSGNPCKSFPLIWSEGVSARDYDHQQVFDVPASLLENATPATTLVVQQIIEQCNEGLTAEGATVRQSFEKSLPTTFIADTDRRDYGNIIAQAHPTYPFYPGEVDHSKTGEFEFNVECDPYVKLNVADQVKYDHGDFKANSVDLTLKTYANDTHQPHPGVQCPVLYVTTRVTANQNGLVGTDRIAQIGGGGPQTDNLLIGTSQQGDGSYAGEKTKKYYLDEGTFAKFYAVIKSGATAISTPWKSITIHCKGPGGGLAVDQDNGNPDNTDVPAGFQTLEGDFAFIDQGAPKCARQGKALLTFRSPKPDNIHYSLDCKHGHYSGVAQTAANPAGGFVGAAVVSFNVATTLDASCTLNTVAPYGPKQHVTREHLFQCVNTAVETPTGEIQVAPRPGNAGVDAASVVMVPPVVKERGRTVRVPDIRKPVPEFARKVIRDVPKREIVTDARRLKDAADAKRAARDRVILEQRRRAAIAARLEAEKERRHKAAASARRLQLRAIDALKNTGTARPRRDVAPAVKTFVPRAASRARLRLRR